MGDKYEKTVGDLFAQTDNQRMILQRQNLLCDSENQFLELVIKFNEENNRKINSQLQKLEDLNKELDRLLEEQDRLKNEIIVATTNQTNPIKLIEDDIIRIIINKYEILQRDYYIPEMTGNLRENESIKSIASMVLELINVKFKRNEKLFKKYMILLYKSDKSDKPLVNELSEKLIEPLEESILLEDDNPLNKLYDQFYAVSSKDIPKEVKEEWTSDVETIKEKCKQFFLYIFDVAESSKKAGNYGLTEGKKTKQNQLLSDMKDIRKAIETCFERTEKEKIQAEHKRKEAEEAAARAAAQEEAEKKLEEKYKSTPFFVSNNPSDYVEIVTRPEDNILGVKFKTGEEGEKVYYADNNILVINKENDIYKIRFNNFILPKQSIISINSWGLYNNYIRDENIDENKLFDIYDGTLKVDADKKYCIPDKELFGKLYKGYSVMKNDKSKIPFKICLDLEPLEGESGDLKKCTDPGIVDTYLNNDGTETKTVTKLELYDPDLKKVFDKYIKNYPQKQLFIKSFLTENDEINENNFNIIKEGKPVSVSSVLTKIREIYSVEQVNGRDPPFSKILTESKNLNQEELLKRKTKKKQTEDKKKIKQYHTSLDDLIRKFNNIDINIEKEIKDLVLYKNLDNISAEDNYTAILKSLEGEIEALLTKLTNLYDKLKNFHDQIYKDTKSSKSKKICYFDKLIEIKLMEQIDLLKDIKRQNPRCISNIINLDTIYKVIDEFRQKIKSKTPPNDSEKLIIKIMEKHNYKLILLLDSIISEFNNYVGGRTNGKMKSIMDTYVKALTQSSLSQIFMGNKVKKTIKSIDDTLFFISEFFNFTYSEKEKQNITRLFQNHKKAIATLKGKDPVVDLLNPDDDSNLASGFRGILPDISDDLDLESLDTDTDIDTESKQNIKTNIEQIQRNVSTMMGIRGILYSKLLSESTIEDLRKHTKDQESTIKGQASTIKGQKSTIGSQQTELARATDDALLLREEYETKQKEMEQENDVLRVNIQEIQAQNETITDEKDKTDELIRELMEQYSKLGLSEGGEDFKSTILALMKKFADYKTDNQSLTEQVNETYQELESLHTKYTKMEQEYQQKLHESETRAQTTAEDLNGKLTALRFEMGELTVKQIDELRIREDELAQAKEENSETIASLEQGHSQKLAELAQSNSEKQTALESLQKEFEEKTKSSDLSDHQKEVLKGELEQIKLKLEMSQREQKAIEKRQTQDILGFTQKLRTENISNDSYLGIIEAYVKTREINEAKRKIFDCFSLKDLAGHEREFKKLAEELSREGIDKQIEELSKRIAELKKQRQKLETQGAEEPVDLAGGGGRIKKTIRKKSVKNKRRQNNRRKKTLKR